MKKQISVLAVLAVFGLCGQAMASGTLSDNGTLVLTMVDASQGWTPISAENDGTYIWTCAGGGTAAPLVRYLQDGTLDASFTPGIDFRSIFASDGGQLYAKEYCGSVYSITPGGVASFLFALPDPDCQSSASLSGDDTELYAFAAPTLYRFNAANGSALGSVGLIGMGGNELNYPANVQMETTADGRILTFSDGVVSEWDLGGNRIGQCTVPVGTPTDFNTIFSFGVGNDGLVYLFNAATGNWEAYDVGAGGPPVAVENASWGQIKASFR